MALQTTIYCIIFLPLIASFLCQVFGKKMAFFVSFSTIFIIFTLILGIFLEISPNQQIANDFELSPLSLALEYKITQFSLIFLALTIFLKITTIFYYKENIEKFLSDQSKIFYSVFLLNCFALIGILTTNNLFNLFLFFEIYSCSFLAIFSITKNLKIARLSFNYFFANALTSLIILFCFFIIYLNFGTTNLDIISQKLIDETLNHKFLITLSSLLFCAFIIKLFPFWLYFKNLKNSNLLADFFAIDTLFIKANLGIFLFSKFAYLFFLSPITILILTFLSVILIAFTLLELCYCKHFKLSIIYLAINNLSMILLCLIFKNEQTFKGLNFYLLNFNLIVFFLFLFANFLQSKTKSSLITQIPELLVLKKLPRTPLIWGFRVLIIFAMSLPFTFSFYGNLHLLDFAINYKFEAIGFMIMFALILQYCGLFIFGLKLLSKLT